MITPKVYFTSVINFHKFLAMSGQFFEIDKIVALGDPKRIDEIVDEAEITIMAPADANMDETLLDCMCEQGSAFQIASIDAANCDA